MRAALTFIVLLTGLRTIHAQEMNVVFIVVDDWGWTDAGVQGSDFYETPRIDRLAAESLRFTQAYAAAPICSPTRAAILTGKVPARLDMTIWHEQARDGGPTNRKLLPAQAVANLPREEITLAELFKQSGYFTAHIGKWHLGTAAYYPETQGFDVNIGGTYWGAPSTFFFPYRGTWSNADPESRYVPVGPGKPGDYLTDRLGDHAVKTMTMQKDRPFFLSLWFHSVHTPIEGKPDAVKRFQDKPSGKLHQNPDYAAMVASVDQNVGRVLDTLKALGLSEKTVVILTSDNGGVDFPTGKSDHRPPTTNSPLRSGKGTLYEGGIRIPLFIRWPGRTQPGTVCATPVSSQDFLPTLAEGLKLDSAPLPEHDGLSLLKLFSDPHASLERDTLYWHYPHYYTRMTPASALREGNWKLIHYYEDDRDELFDLQEDPGESQDLSSMQKHRVTALRKKLNTWLEEVGANLPRPNPDWKAKR